jgi:hypothetical protein
MPLESTQVNTGAALPVENTSNRQRNPAVCRRIRMFIWPLFFDRGPRRGFQLYSSPGLSLFGRWGGNSQILMDMLL